jgi:uncharacterized membrane protein YfcA
MVYVLSVIGFIGGFALGLFFIQLFLKNKSNEELLKDRGLKWKFGLIPWIGAIIGAYSMMVICTEFFY